MVGMSDSLTRQLEAADGIMKNAFCIEEEAVRGVEDATNWNSDLAERTV